jgi:hypothetical protein
LLEATPSPQARFPSSLRAQRSNPSKPLSSAFKKRTFSGKLSAHATNKDFQEPEQK